MSFSSLKVSELRKVAETFAVDVPQRAKKEQIIEALHEEGITYAEYQKFADTEKVEPEPQLGGRPPLVVENEETVLVRMVRQNPSYQVEGITFTQEHPYVALPVSRARAIIENHQGFQVATPWEAQEFYS